MYIDTTNPRHQQLQEIERIENLPRPRRWVETKTFLLRLRPDLAPVDRGFVEACKDLREKSTTNITAASKSGSMRNTMKLPQYLYEALLAMDPQLATDLGGQQGEAAANMGKQLYNAFPEYRIARKY